MDPFIVRADSRTSGMKYWFVRNSSPTTSIPGTSPSLMTRWGLIPWSIPCCVSAVPSFAWPLMTVKASFSSSTLSSMVWSLTV